MTERIITLPYPHKDLSQNARINWRPLADLKAKYRHDAWALTLEAKVPFWEGARLEFTFHPPDARKRDVQNVPAMLKAAIDGIADGMGCDDNGFRCKFPEEFAGKVKSGCVVVRITPKLVTDIEHRGKIG